MKQQQQQQQQQHNIIQTVTQLLFYTNYNTAIICRQDLK